MKSRIGCIFGHIPKILLRFEPLGFSIPTGLDILGTRKTNVFLKIVAILILDL